MILKPNEKISISVNDSDQVISKPGKVTAAKRDLQKIPQVIVADLTPNPTDNIIPEIAWTQNRIYFKEESLENIAPIIERWYGKKVVIRNESLKKMAYTCNLENVTLENLLAYLKLSNPFNFRFEKDTVIIF
jgi:ferric-dicitrate binding protein FerR (iron transport regulator)